MSKQRPKQRPKQPNPTERLLTTKAAKNGNGSSLTTTLPSVTSWLGVLVAHKIPFVYFVYFVVSLACQVP